MAFEATAAVARLDTARRMLPVAAADETILDGKRLKMCVISLQLLDHVPALLQ